MGKERRSIHNNSSDNQPPPIRRRTGTKPQQHRSRGTKTQPRMVSFVPRPALVLLVTAVVVMSACLLLSSRPVEGFVTIITTTTTTRPVSSASAGATVLHDKKWGDEPSENKTGGGGGLFGAVSNFFEELDAFVDDATARRLGAGAQYYGKRKSRFYGEDDKNKKLDKNVADSAEDFMVNAGGNFKWITDADGNLRPVSRMKQTSVEKPANMWGRQDTTPMKLKDRMQE